MNENIFIRLYFYLNSGVNILNNFRNLFLGIFALYFALKLTSPILMVLMFVISLPILVVIGYYNIHKVAKVSEQLSIQYGTHYGLKQFELTEKMVELLTKINEK